MKDIIDKFFYTYWKPGMPTVYTKDTPQEMMLSEVDAEGWYEWKLIPGTLSIEDYQKIESDFRIKFPDRFKEWHKRYFFADCDCAIVRLPRSLPTLPLEDIKSQLDWFIPKKIIPQGLIPFASEGNDSGPLVFDIRSQENSNDYPIRVYDHEYRGDLAGLSEIIFSSFDKMLECLIYFFTEMEQENSLKVISGFWNIDPDGAGSTGKSYWESWINSE